MQQTASAVHEHMMSAMHSRLRERYISITWCIHLHHSVGIISLSSCKAYISITQLVHSSQHHAACAQLTASLRIQHCA
jgi:hypothetical protein